MTETMLHPTTTGPTDRLLRSFLVIAPLTYLAADATYAASGWDDATGGVLHVLGAIAFGFAVLAVTAQLPTSSKLAATLLLVGVAGMAGNVAYGFDTIHQSFGDASLVDRGGAATLIKPLGLLFPLSLVLVAAVLHRGGHGWQAATVLLAGVAWPVGHIANLAEVAIPANVALLAALGSVAIARSLGPERPAH